MTSKIFESVLSATVIVLILSLGIITGVLYQHFGDVQKEQLRDELYLASSATEQLGLEYLESLSSDQYRLTWIDADGTVLFDSHADEDVMDNHADREEIQEALSSGEGDSTRHSATLTQQTLYEATRLNDGSVLRISVSRASVLALLFGMLQPIGIVILIAIALSAWLANRMAKRVIEPLNHLNLESPLENDIYEEITPLLRRIHAQHKEIETQVNALKQKQEEFEQITSNMNEALVLLDDNERIISINPAAKVLFDTDAQCIGEDFFSIDRKQDIWQAICDAKERGTSYFRAKKNNRDYQFDISCIALEGNIRGLVILAFDITEQVHAENHRREFTANVSHELKTPLQSMIGYAELMSNGIAKEDDVPRFLHSIQKEGARLVTLIDDIIRLSQLDEGVDLPMERVSLRELSKEVCEVLHESATTKDVSLEVVGSAGEMDGVQRLLFEMIYNLCDNAIKYNKTGGSVQIAITDKEHSIELSIADNGIGIAPEHQEKVFERFYRVDKSHSKESGGTGLGLSIVKHAVQHHHGKICVDSKVGIGTKITIIFETSIR